MPFITEKLWSFINNNKIFLMNELYTNLQIINKFNKSQTNIKKLIKIISSVRNIRSELNISYKESIDINISNKDTSFIKFLHNYNNELRSILKLNKLSFDFNTNKMLGTAYIVVTDTTLTIPLKNIVDTKKELKKLHEKKNNELNN